MRIPSRISPSGLAKYEKDRESFYLTYCAEPRLERDPQPVAASVGSAFDAFVKAKLVSDLFGNETFEELFESQVEPQNRDFAHEAGQHIMENYLYCGAYAELLNLLTDAQEEPQFEFNANTVVGGIPIAGKPDCRFVHKDGAHIILDWKMNGYCGSKSAVSPSKGYMICRDGMGWPEKGSRSHGKPHALYEPDEYLGIPVNKFSLEQISIDWADQCTMYGWMMGEEVGSQEVVVRIEQGVGKPTGDGGALNGHKPLLRFATHSCRITPEYQKQLFNRLKKMWDSIQSQHIFDELSKTESDAKCADMDKRVFSMLSDGTAEQDFFAQCARPRSFYKGR